MRFILLFLLSQVFLLGAANAQAWKDCVPGSIGPGGCDSIGPGGGQSIGPGGGQSIMHPSEHKQSICSGETSSSSASCAMPWAP
jgi:hypothetical protein